jgi:predicted helicase
MNNQHCNTKESIEKNIKESIERNIKESIERNIKESIERNNIKLDIYNKFMDELITNFHLLNLKFFNSGMLIEA